MIPKSTRDLHEGIYREHLEEISVLYDSWLLRMRDPGYNGFDFLDADRRMDGHLDALAENGGCSDICMAQALGGDIGECYGAVRVLLRQSRHDHFNDLICRINPNETNRMQGLVDAICHEPASLLPDDFPDTLMPMDACRTRIVARVAACHRFDCTNVLYEALRVFKEDTDMLNDVLHALGRRHFPYGADRLSDFLGHSNNEIIHKAMETLLIIGDKKALDSCLSRMKSHAWPAQLLGLYGDRDITRDALFSMDAGDLSPDHMIAAGLTGDVTLFPNLMTWLEAPHLSGHAAMALNLITGLAFYEEHFAPDVTCEEDLFDDEKEAWKNGTLYPDGAVPGQTVIRLSRDPDVWSAGLRNSGIPFDPDKRYRMGRPCSPSCVFDVINSKIFPDAIRQLCCEEMAVSYGIHIPFDIRMTASHQKAILESYAGVIQSQSSTWIEGAWYYQGQPVNNELEPNEKPLWPN